MLEAKNIKSIQDMQVFVEGCINDFEFGISDKNETLENLKDYTFHILGINDKTLFEYISGLAKKLFPKAGPKEHLLKLKQEAIEAINKPDDIYEYADIFFALLAALSKQGFNFNDLVEATIEKAKINEKRKWKEMPDGTHQHIES